MKLLVVSFFIITLVHASPQLNHQDHDNNHHLNPIHDAEIQQEEKEQQKRTIFGQTVLGPTRHVGIHPLGFKYVLGYGPIGYYPYAKPVTYLKPVIQTQGWKPIVHVPVAKPVKPVKPEHPHVHFHPIKPILPIQPVQPVVPVQPAQPVVPVEKPVVQVVPEFVQQPPAVVKPVIPFQPQVPYIYPFFKPLTPVVQPAVQIQPPFVTPIVHQNPVVQTYIPQQPVFPQPVVHQHPIVHPNFIPQPQPPQFVHQFVPRFPVPLPGVANPVGPIEPTNSVHTSFSATYPRHPIVGVHTPQPVVPVNPPLIHQVPLQPVVPQFPIQPHLLHVIRQFPHLFRHITPLYPINPAQPEVPKPIVPPVTIHNPVTTQDSGVSVQIPSHLPEHPNYRPDNIPHFYPIQPETTDQGVHHSQVPDFHPEQHGHVDNTFVIPQQPQQPQQPVHPAPQTPLYLPPHPFLRQGGQGEHTNSIHNEFGATYPRNPAVQLPAISLEPPYRRTGQKL